MRIAEFEEFISAIDFIPKMNYQRSLNFMFLKNRKKLLKK